MGGVPGYYIKKAPIPAAIPSLHRHHFWMRTAGNASWSDVVYTLLRIIKARSQKARGGASSTPGPPDPLDSKRRG